MKKNDINTRSGRARRRTDEVQFNPDTLLPHSKKFIKDRKESKSKRGKK